MGKREGPLSLRVAVGSLDYATIARGEGDHGGGIPKIDATPVVAGHRLTKMKTARGP